MFPDSDVVIIAKDVWNAINRWQDIKCYIDVPKVLLQYILSTYRGEKKKENLKSQK